MTLTHNQVSYFYQTIREIGLTHQEAWEYGIQEAPNGNIQFLIKNFYGEPLKKRKRVPVFDDKGRPVLSPSGKQKTQNGALELLFIERIHPNNIDPNNPGKKYNFPAGVSPKPQPGLLAQRRFTSNARGGSAFMTEGYKKAVSLDINGVEAIAVNGIGLYRIDIELKDYLECRGLGNFGIVYDSDALDIRRDKKTGYYTDRRVRNFYGSSLQFAKQFFALELNTALHLIIGRTESKGIDDAIRAEGAEVITEALESLKTSRYFDVLRLRKSTFDKRLKQVFALSDHISFYIRYQDKIQFNPFVFDGITYQRVVPESGKNLFGAHGLAFKVLDNPLNIDLPASKYVVNKFLAEKKESILHDISGDYKTYLEAPTGTGKTHFIFNHLPGRTVLAVPTVNLAKQIAKGYGVPCIIGGMKPKERAKALQAEKIVCVYDMLPAISDIHSRIFIVDEAHNITNQFSFREPALKYIAELVSNELPEQIIFLSGTPNKLLCKAWDFNFIQVRREVNNTVLVNPMTAATGSKKAFLEAACTHLQGIDWSSGKVTFVLWDNIERLEALRDYLLKYTSLEPLDILLFDKDEVKHGSEKKFRELIEKSELSGVKLVLSTQIIAEGVNINNKNLNQVVTININCPDLFRQFTNRFRKAKELQVFDIKPPERAIGAAFPKNAWNEYQQLKTGYGDQEKRIISNEQNTRLSELNPETELPYSAEIEPKYNYSSVFFKYGYSSEGQAHINELKIFSGIRERIISNSNNTFFYSQVTEQPGIKLNTESIALEATESIALDISEVQTSIKSRREATHEQLIKDLKESPEIVISALYRHYKAKKDRKGKAAIKKRAPELIQEGKQAEQYRYNYPEIFKDRTFTGLILDYIRLHAIKLNTESIALELDNWSQSKFTDKWKAWKHSMEAEIYRDRNKRKVLKAEHRLDIRALESLKKQFDEKPPKTLSSAKAIINNQLSGVGVLPLKESEVLTILKKLYKVEIKQKYIRREWTSYESQRSDKYELPKNKRTRIKAEKEKILHLEQRVDLFVGAKISLSEYCKVFL